MSAVERPFLRIRVCRGTTVPMGPDKWERGEWEIQADVPSGKDPQQVILEYETILLAKVAKLQEAIPPPRALNMKPAESPQKPVETILDGLAWSKPNQKGYQWIQRKVLEQHKDLETFLQTLIQQSLAGWVKQGGYVYRLSGENNTLVGRIPARPDR